MNRENFQELMSEGRLLEIALQYLLESETQEKKERHTEHITGYIQERMEKDVGACTGVLLNRLGITPNLKGHTYLRKAIELEVESNSSMEGMMKCLYPQVAADCNASPASVERNIRQFIARLHEKGAAEYAALLGQSPGERPLSNKEFLLRLAELVRRGGEPAGQAR